MRAEYKRDVNHNYLILHGEQAVNTASYQVRMLVGNVIPSILKCRLQGLDGEVLFYYEITSRQSVASMYEQRKFGKEDLKLLFGGFVQVMEEMGEYLLNPGYLVLQPEYMFLDVEKRQLGFCYLPGEEREVKGQFRNLTEYVLPRVDHQDGGAVMLGYGVYRRALEDCFHLEHIKEELYQEKGKEEVSDEDVRKLFGMEEGKEQYENSLQIFDTKVSESVFPEEREWSKAEKRKFQSTGEEVRRIRWRVLLFCTTAAGGIFGLMMCIMLGYLPRPGMEELLMGVLICLAAGLLVSFIPGKLKKKKSVAEEENWREKITASREKREVEEKADENTPGKAAAEKEAAEAMELRKETKEKDPPDLRAGGAFGETVLLSSVQSGQVSLVSREPGELATIYLTEDLTVIGKMENASDAVIPVPTVSRIHAKIRRREGEYYLTDLNSRNGTSVNGRMLKGDEEYLLKNEDEVDFARARYIFLR